MPAGAQDCVSLVRRLPRLHGAKGGQCPGGRAAVRAAEHRLASGRGVFIESCQVSRSGDERKS
ncbi:MAG: hypothetical protein PHQ34_08770 [Methanothrix sp.]|nr:hypothetical protein [Methanothrix sp.]